MRTSIFNNFADLPKEFREDVQRLWQMPKQVRLKLISHAANVAKARTSNDRKLATDEATQGTKQSPADLLKVLKLLLYVYEAWNPIRDSPESFQKDLADLGLIPVKKKAECKLFLDNFLAQVAKDNTYRLEKMFAVSLLPSYQSCATLVDMRTVIRNPFGAGLKDKLAEYEPQCVGFVPVVLVKINRDSGDPPSFSFQCEEDALERMIEILQATLKDLQAAKGSLQEGAKQP